jgi:hypothetical protein
MEPEQIRKREGSPRPMRQTKRSKQPLREICNDTQTLPAEMWAQVMNHLDLASVLSMTASSRTMSDAAPFVTELHILKVSDF